MLALKKAMEATLDETTWKELGYATDSIDWINNHGRLLRSLHWGDSDYGSCVLDAVEYIADRDPANIEVILDFPGIKDWLRQNEPAVYDEYCGGDVPAVGSLADAQEAGAGFDVEAHIRRIRDSLAADPAQAIGSTKELRETVFKTALGMHGARTGNDEMPKLLKRTQAALGLDPADFDGTMPGSESLRKLFGSMAQIVVSATELRNLFGTGHGKSNAPSIDPAMANLVVASGTALAAYLMNRYREMQSK
ncbi:MAG: abortive infection family protein [Planctomycetia bacterium]|nr:abortive infection family protein [Planctomycetia bacterium]